jgi:hypothetical protein
MATTHTTTSELTADPNEYTLLYPWIAAKVGDDKATEMTINPEDGANPTLEFSYFYDAWLVDQKITHIVEVDGDKPYKKVISYKDITPERYQLCLTKLV